MKIVYDKTYPPSTTDFGPVIRAAQATGADIFYAASYPPDSVGLLRAAREIGYLPKMFGGSMIGLQTTTIQMQLGPLLNGVTTIAAWLPVKTLMFPGVMEMLKKYQAQAKGEGVDPLGYFLAPAAYAYIQLLGEAVEQAGTLDQAKLADYIHTHTFTTVYGDFDFAEDGETDRRSPRARSRCSITTSSATTWRSSTIRPRSRSSTRRPTRPARSSIPTPSAVK